MGPRRPATPRNTSCVSLRKRRRKEGLVDGDAAAVLPARSVIVLTGISGGIGRSFFQQLVEQKQKARQRCLFVVGVRGDDKRRFDFKSSLLLFFSGGGLAAAAATNDDLRLEVCELDLTSSASISLFVSQVERLVLGENASGVCSIVHVAGTTSAAVRDARSVTEGTMRVNMTGVAQLTQGLHPLLIRYFEAEGVASRVVVVSSTGGKLRALNVVSDVRGQRALLCALLSSPSTSPEQIVGLAEDAIESVSAVGGGCGVGRYHQVFGRTPSYGSNADLCGPDDVYKYSKLLVNAWVRCSAAAAAAASSDAVVYHAVDPGSSQSGMNPSAQHPPSRGGAIVLEAMRAPVQESGAYYEAVVVNQARATGCRRVDGGVPAAVMLRKVELFD